MMQHSTRASAGPVSRPYATGPLTKKRTGTIDVDVGDRAVDYIKWQAGRQPLFLRVNFTDIRHRVHRSTEGRSCRISELALKTNAEPVIRRRMTDNGLRSLFQAAPRRIARRRAVPRVRRSGAALRAVSARL